METILFFSSATRLSCRDRLDGILSVVQKHKWHVQVIERAYNRIDVKAELDFWRPIGIIAECGSRADELNRESFGDIPTVYFERDPRLRHGDTMLMLDSTAVGRLAARELLALGFENFAYIPFRDATIYWSVERGKAFAAALARAGKGARFFSSPAEGTLRRAALKEFLRALTRPSALFVANDLTAVEVIDIASTAGLDVPGDLSLLSVDNDTVLCEKTEPAISSINPDYVFAGQLAASKLAHIIETGEDRGELIKFEPIGIVRRASLLPPTTGNARALEERARDYIKANIESAPCVSDISRALGCSRRALEMQFRKATGQTLLEAIHEAVFERACEMSRANRLSSAAIPDFLQISHDTLNRIFRAKTGLTLAEWRKANAPTVAGA